jgi:hypothetical protein
MAMTLEELLNWYPGVSYPAVTFVLTIVQQDGRAAFASGDITEASVNPLPHVDGTCEQQFSDRTVNISLSGANYRQNFIKELGQVDQSTVRLERASPSSIQLHLLNKRWGASTLVPMTLSSSAKVYTGWGDTIGQGEGRAMYAFTINSAVETPG